jgi:hypothetical protein
VLGDIAKLKYGGMEEVPLYTAVWRASYIRGVGEGLRTHPNTDL